MTSLNITSVSAFDYPAESAARLQLVKRLNEPTHLEARAAVAPRSAPNTIADNLDALIVTFMIISGVLAYTILGIMAVA